MYTTALATELVVEWSHTDTMPQSGTNALAADLLTTFSSPSHPWMGGRPAALRPRPLTVVAACPRSPPRHPFSCTPAFSCCQACFFVAKRGLNERHLLSMGVLFLFSLEHPPHLCFSLRHKKMKKITVLDTLRQSEGRLLTQKTALNWAWSRTMTRHDMACTSYGDEDSRCDTTT